MLSSEALTGIPCFDDDHRNATPEAELSTASKDGVYEPGWLTPHGYPGQVCRIIHALFIALSRLDANLDLIQF